MKADLAMQSGQAYSIATGKLPFPPTALTEAVRFLRACLAHSAKVTAEQVLTNQTLPSISSYLYQVIEASKLCSVMIPEPWYKVFPYRSFGGTDNLLISYVDFWVMGNTLLRSLCQKFYCLH